ncbi:MAG: DUF3048 domain-containing protein [Firmicutes bacterium]|nr:DUF3048 domain-containing protein [Bacillota bacterium]
MWYRLLAALLVCVVLSGCSTQPLREALSGNDEQKEEEKLHPFTGEKMKEEATGPPLMVMVNNHSKARPQTGLNRADMLVEVLAEGGITRLAAFFYGEDEGRVGPIRSTRPYYLNLTKGPGAVVVHAGGSPAALNQIKSQSLASLDALNGEEEVFQRVDFRHPPHNLYSDLKQLLRKAAEKGYAKKAPDSPYRFNKQRETEGKAASRIEMTFHRLFKAGFRYDASSDQYIRYTEGKQHRDRLTDQALSADNVLVIRAPHQVIDASGRRKVELTGKGEGMLFQGGTARVIRWEYRDGWIVPLVDGKVASFFPGKTWIHVLPEKGELSYR